MNLYRNPADADHWYTRVSKNVWLRFPAVVNGWMLRRQVTMMNFAGLQPVPRWLAFNTGMPKAPIQIRSVTPRATAKGHQRAG